MTKPRSLKPWLTASVALNVFLLSVAAGLGYIAHDRCRLPPAGPDRKPALHHLTDGLSEDSREKVRKVVTAAALDGEADMRAGAEYRKAAVAILLSDTPDTAAAAAEIARARASENRAKDKLEAAVVALVAELPPAERAVVAEHLVRAPFRVRHKALHDLRKAENGGRPQEDRPR